MLAASIIFGLSLLAIIGLFVLKSIEIRRGGRFAPALRDRADDEALRLKEALLNSRVEASKLPPLMLYIARRALHEAALGLAQLGRIIERESHRLADLVSHKRGFERREPKSEFLKQVTDHKNGNGTVEDLEHL